MKFNADGWIAGGVFVSSIVLAGVLLTGIGAVQPPTQLREVTLDFGRVDNIKPNLTQIKLAGIPIGKVTEVRILTIDERREQAQNKAGASNHIRVKGRIAHDIALSDLTTASIRQASLMSEHFIELDPGPVDAPPMRDSFVIQGASARGVGDVVGGSGEMLGNLKDASASIKALLATVNVKLPSVMDRLNAVLGSADVLVGDISSAESRENIKKTLGNLRVMSENLKVVSTHAKLLTATLAQRPWRVIFGGKPNELPDEQAVIANTKAHPVKVAEDSEPPKEQPKPAPKPAPKTPAKPSP